MLPCLTATISLLSSSRKWKSFKIDDLVYMLLLYPMEALYINVQFELPFTLFEPLHNLFSMPFETEGKVARTLTSLLLFMETIPGARINIP